MRLTSRLGSLALLITLFLLLSSLIGGTGVASVSVHYVDVGHGDAILIQCHTCEARILIDSGDRSSLSRSTLLGYLEDLGISSLCAVVATHPHSDHIGGFAAVFERFPVKRIYDSGYQHTTRLYREYMELIVDLRIPYSPVRAGDTIEVTGITLSVIHPDEDGFDTYRINDSSVVLRFVYGEIAFLFTGDAERAAERAILAGGAEISSNILKVGHHGSSTSSTREFLAAVGPEVAIVMVDGNNRYGLPSMEVISALEAMGSRVYRTDTNGSIVVSTDGLSYQIATERTGAKDRADSDTLAGSSDHQRPEQARVNINSASIDDLRQIVHIGPVRADSIHRGRPWSSIDDLISIQGIGPATLQDIKDQGLAYVE